MSVTSQEGDTDEIWQRILIKRGREMDLLEILEDLTGQLQMGKCSEEDVLEVLKNVVNFEEE